MQYRLFSVVLGVGLIFLGVYTDAESRGGSGGGGGFHGGGGGGGFHGGDAGGFSRSGYQGTSFHAGQPGPGPYRASPYPTSHVNNYYQPHTAGGNPLHQSGQVHQPGNQTKAAQGVNLAHLGNQPPNVPYGGHNLPQGQHPRQPQQWHRNNFNQNWANHPNQYPNGHWNNGWYNGYWHNYWGDENWLWWGGAYGFWLGLDEGEVFVTESQPWVCNYWNGVQWVPWYTQGLTPYQCPY